MSRKTKTKSANNDSQGWNSRTWMPLAVAVVTLVGVIVTAVMGCWGPILAAVLPVLIQSHDPDPMNPGTPPVAIFTPSPITTQLACPEEGDIVFDADSLNGWKMRYEGSTRLGENLALAHDVPCTNADDAALAFTFQFPNYSHAQIVLEGRGLPLSMEMSAWAYNPPGGPEALAGQCFIMSGPEANYKWYDTPPVPLPAGEWVKLTCPLNAFRPDSAWPNPPLIIGLQFYDTQGRAMLSTIYVDNISIK